MQCDADGNEQIIKTCEALEGGIAVELTGDATIKIVENSKEFRDVKAGNWAADPIQFVVSREIFKGTSATTFYRLAILQGKVKAGFGEGKLSVFSDAASISEFAREALAWATAEGLILGNGGKIDPKGLATRAQVAAIMQRYCSL